MLDALDTSKLAIVYPRQSTNKQVEDNIYSLERQLALRERAISDGFPVDCVIVVDDDLGLSGRTITKRPGFTRALDLIDRGEVAAIYVEDLTRLSRDERTIDQMLIADVCERAGTRIYMGGSWYDMRDSGQRQSYKYQAVGGAEYWRMHLGKLQSGRRRKAAEGRSAGSVPRGYRTACNERGEKLNKRDPGYDRLTIYEPEAAIIRTLVAALPDAGSLRELYRRNQGAVWPDGARITYWLLKKILKSPTYRGTYVWGGEFVPNAHEAIITPEQAAMIDNTLALNRATKRRATISDERVLAGLIHCGDCGRKVYSASSEGRATYRCDGPLDALTSGIRSHFSVYASRFDSPVLAAMWEQLQGPMVDNIIANLRVEREQAGAVVDLGEEARRALQRKIDGLMRSLSDPDASELVRKMLLADLDATARKLEAVGKREQGKDHTSEALRFYEDFKAAPEWAAALPSVWDDEPLQWRRDWLRRFVEKVEVSRPSGGRFALVVTWRDGTQTELSQTTSADWTPEEVDIILSAWDDPERPRLGYAEFVRARLAAAGYERTRSALYHFLPKLLKRRKR